MPVNATISGNRIILESQYQHQDRIKRMLGASQDKVSKQWTLPLTWTSAVSLKNDFGDEFLASETLNAWGYSELEGRVGPARTLRTRMDLEGLDETKTDETTLTTIAARELAAELGLYPHQAAGAAFAAVTKSALILDEQGTGKTAQTITAVRTLFRRGHAMFPLLVVCPSSVKNVWQREFNRWYPGLTVTNVKGTAAQRRKQLEAPAHVVIISYNNLPKHSKLATVPGAPALKRCEECGGYSPEITEAKCQAHIRELNIIPFATVILDEAHRVTDPKSTWTRAAWAISDQATYRYALTGTPVQESIKDYWALLRFVAPDEFPAKTKFIDRYAIVGYTPWGQVEIEGLNPLREDELAAITSAYTRRMLKEIVLPFLPPVYEERRTVEMTGAQAKAYRDLEKSMLTELASDTPMVTLSPLTQATRLMQLASSYAEVLDDDFDEDDMFTDTVPPTVKLKMPSNKITSLMDDIAAGDYSQTDAGKIVFAQSAPLLDMLSQEMTAKGIEHGMITGSISEDDRQQAIDDFQAGKTKYILVSIAAGGAGLTLTAADTMIFLQRAWSSTAMTQAYARADRIGSEIHESIRIVHYLSEKTVEEPQLDALALKADRADEILRDRASLLAWLKESKEAAA